jgi:hypothetical protein
MKHKWDIAHIRRNTMVSNEGIDKVAVYLNPCFIDKESYTKFFDPRNYVTAFHYKQIYILYIEAEALDPYRSYTDQIVDYVLLFLDRNLLATYFCNNLLLASQWIKQYNQFLFSICEMEFYFDFKPEEVEIFEDNSFIKIKSNKNDDNEVITYYSNDYKNVKSGNKMKKRKSTLIIYDRKACLKKRKRIKHEIIDNMTHSKRLEIRYTSNNFSYLNFNNLNGTYDDIFNRYLQYLSIAFCKYVQSNVCFLINYEDYPHFYQLCDMSFKESPKRIKKTTLAKKQNVTKSFLQGNELVKDVKTKGGVFTDEKPTNDKAPLPVSGCLLF